MNRFNLKGSHNKQPHKFCQHCGQKTFRPHRSVKELLWEFIENWFGYDSKAYKTAKALCQPAKLSLDYFNNSHHHNHYVTPIKLYIFLSIIFFLLTQFGGLNLTDLKIQVQTSPQAQEQVNLVLRDAPLLEQPELEQPKLPVEETVQPPVAVDEASPSSLIERCKTSHEIINAWPQWLDNYFDKKMDALCEAYTNIQYLPKGKQDQALTEFGLSIVQNAIEFLPQTFLLTLPFLALVLKVLYIRSSHLYVEHLVLLIHSHSFLFAAILVYLGWYQLADSVEWLEGIPVKWGLLIWALVYLYLSMKRFYQQKTFKTITKFILFSISYVVIIGFFLIVAAMKALISI